MKEGLNRRDLLKGIVAGAATLGATGAEAADKKLAGPAEIYPGHTKDTEDLKKMLEQFKNTHDEKEKEGLRIQMGRQIEKINEATSKAIPGNPDKKGN